MYQQNSNRFKRKARLRVLAKRRFFIHLGIFGIVSLFLFTINILTGSTLWFYWPVISWGLAVAIHYLVTFGVPGTDILSKEWEEREYEKEMYILERKDAMAKNKLTEKTENPEQPDELELREPVKMKKDWDQDLV